MPHLAQPLYLLLLLLLPLLVRAHLRRRRCAIPHPALALFVDLPRGRAPLAEYGGLALRTLALVLLVVALAQPRWPDLRTRLDTEGVALMLAVDVSGSMAERDFDWDGQLISRLDAVKRIFGLFVAGGDSGQRGPDGSELAFEGRPGDLLGLVCFATRPEATCPLTLEHASLLRLLEAEEARGVPGESETNLSDAMALGLARLKAAGPRHKVLVLLTDGEHNQAETRSGWTPRQAAQVAASLGVTIHAIDAGAEPSPPPLSPRPGERGGGEGAGEESGAARAARDQAVATLKEIAAISGGRYFAARDSQGLAAACRAIDRLERSPIASFQYRRYHEAYPWLGLAAFVSFVSALALEQTLWRKLP